MRYLLLLLLMSCSAPDFSRVGQLYRSDGGYGTAFPVAHAADGFYVLTCWHVVKDDDPNSFTLFLGGKSYFDGLLTWEDEDSDTALVGFVTEDRPEVYEIGPVPVPYSRGYAAGYPLGMSSLIVGDVMFQGGRIINHLTGPGGSGGPVFDQSGRVCGIVSMIRTPKVRPWNGHAMMGWITQMSLLGSVSQKLIELR